MPARNPPLGHFGRRLSAFLSERNASALDIGLNPAERRQAVLKKHRPRGGAWVPLGPFVVRKGQGATQPATSGRISSIAVGQSGRVVYAASHNGGVWRSDDGGRTWNPLMDAFDQAATAPGSDSLACGAVAIHPHNPDRIFVGTGEAYAAVDFRGHQMGYFGVGPVVSEDGGRTWRTEAVGGTAPDVLVGSGFFALAVDPADPQRVLGATLAGLFRREPNGRRFHWVPKTPWKDNPEQNVVTSVVTATRGDATVFYAVRHDGKVFSSHDGDEWDELAAIPVTRRRLVVAANSDPALVSSLGAIVSRITLAIASKDPQVLYALTDTERVFMLHISRPVARWRKVRNVPPGFLNGASGIPLFGRYAQAVVVDPDDSSCLYIGGASAGENGDSGAVYRCQISDTSMVPTFIGDSLHPDIHALVFTPDDPSQLWVGCDGGVFSTSRPRENGDIFEPRNLGLATVSVNSLAQHPTEDAILFCGTQDNGTLRYTGDEAWLLSGLGDGGATVINGADPRIIVSGYLEGGLHRWTDGGGRDTGDNVTLPLRRGETVLLYPPMVGVQGNAQKPDDAGLLVFGSIRPWISHDFGLTWQSVPKGTLRDTSLDGLIRALALASADKLYVGTVSGSVYVFETTGGKWGNSRRLHPPPGGSRSFPEVPVTSIAVDLADASGDSIYISIGGSAPGAHIWHFDGKRWTRRNRGLPEVQFNAVAVDPRHHDHIYSAADVGVWRSLDRGTTWQDFSGGLPGAAVLTLQFHPTRPFLRAGTYGRGVFECLLDDRQAPIPELYVRRTILDRGLYDAVVDSPDPTEPGVAVGLTCSPDIRLDAGIGPVPRLDYLQFADLNANTLTLKSGEHTRIYVQVHNRAPKAVREVHVWLLLVNATRAMDGLPRLPTNCVKKLRTGNSPRPWTIVGTDQLADVAVQSPRIASFEVTPEMLPPPGERLCLVALVDHQDDPLVLDGTDLKAILTRHRKIACRVLDIV